MAKKKQPVKEQSNAKYVRWFWALFLTGVIAFVLLFLSASAFGDLPDHTVLENPKTNLATEIISSDGKTLGKFYFNDNRTPIGYESLSQNLIDALVATEDIRFYEHSGIDGRGTLRAFAKMGKGGGASTISQQLAKLLFHGEGSKNIVERIGQKVKEWIIAIRLERQYTKEEIIAQYFNIYDFGNNGDGIKSASNIYFGKQPKDLNLKESAMLVGMFKNSSLYNPRSNPVGVKNRRNVVLAQMQKYGYITERVKDSLQQTDLDLNYTPESHREGIATYFREYLKKFMKDWINKNPKPDGTKYNLYGDGLKVYTTIDSRMQQYAEEAVQNHMIDLQKEFDIQNTPDRNPTTPFLGLTKDEVDGLLKRSMRQSERWRKMKRMKKSDEEIIKSFNTPIPMTLFSWQGDIDTIMKPLDSMRYYKKFLHPGMMSMDPETGHVKAWVGGMNYRHFQYDHVKQGKRQVGSTFKPFVYATAIDQLHLSPCDEFPDVPYTIEEGRWGNLKDWTPENSGLTYGGTRTLKNALANSVNTITARLMDKVGPSHVIDMAHKLGVTTEIPEVPSIALGTVDLSVFEMVAAYATFANQGVYTEPVMVTSVEDKNNTILYQFTPKTKDVLSEEVAYVTVKLLEGVTESGSGARLRTQGAEKWNAMYREIMTGYPYKLTNPIAGKTGTTQNQSDGWFMGMVPNLVTGVWVGAEDRAVHFRSITYGQGASMALPIWGSYMSKCYADEDLNISTEAFKEPETLTIRVDCDASGNASDSDALQNQGTVDDLDF
ncbi:penicillin-binding protein 1A [Formosa algae]|uniref:Penicillin-binding protein 1A n=1 Tax=Formosa algae TaxID=225843 RepID=A0A9X0YIN2_9FLAO|nr:transglycosylase domain-containing protein [Formosa algae]MBP1838543.1 penicillin-binding protein 1A [Formosa algae]MDQ0335043.1 penicillin-binding protein 1A [Formosa algae]OEI79619.1 penicillin-binding protein [Formosa algae]